MKLVLKLPMVFGVMLILTMAGCNLDPIVEAIKLLDQTAVRIADESNDWRDELKRGIDLAEDLPEEVRSLVKNELSLTLDHAIQATSSEVRCNVQFVRDLIKGDIQRLIAQLKQQKIKRPDPTICTISPDQVDIGLPPNERQTLTYSGYNFPLDPQDGIITVELQEGNQTIDISDHLEVLSGFGMVLDMGTTGAQLTLDSKAIRLIWDERRISSVPVIQSTCEIKEETFKPKKHTFTPPHTAGDRDFKGHGPKVTIDFRLLTRNNRVSGLLSMVAEEEHADGSIAGDGTEIRGIDESSGLDNLYNPEPGWEIIRVVGTRRAEFEYWDDNTEDDVKEFASGPVRRFTVIGNTKGNDVGETSVTIVFNQIKVQVSQTNNCIP